MRHADYGAGVNMAGVTTVEGFAGPKHFISSHDILELTSVKLDCLELLSTNLLDLPIEVVNPCLGYGVSFLSYS